MNGIRLFKRVRGDQRGMALIEFAFAAPVLTLLFIGGYQLMDATSAYRKVTTTDRALADLTTQSTSTTAAGVQQFMNASQQIMAPYPKANAVLIISQVKVDPLIPAADGYPKVTIDWSQSLNGTGYAKGLDVSGAVPAGLRVAGTYLIAAEIRYSYVPNVASGMIGTIPLHDIIFMSPRNSQSVPCPDC